MTPLMPQNAPAPAPVNPLIAALRANSQPTGVDPTGPTALSFPWMKGPPLRPPQPPPPPPVQPPVQPPEQPPVQPPEQPPEQPPDDPVVPPWDNWPPDVPWPPNGKSYPPPQVPPQVPPPSERDPDRPRGPNRNDIEPTYDYDIFSQMEQMPSQPTEQVPPAPAPDASINEPMLPDWYLQMMQAEDEMPMRGRGGMLR